MTMEDQLSSLLQGLVLEEGPIDIMIQTDYVPIAKETVGYIVCGIVFNDDGEVLMTQEAKMSCYGEWYLPAGRLESSESIVDGVKREVLEETGIEFNPTTLLAVEVASGFWYRFTLTGPVIGGECKTYEKRDKESLQAKWASVEEIKSGRKEFPLRAHDILPLIDIAVEHCTSTRHYADILPLSAPHSQLLIRAVFLQTDTQSGAMQVLVGKPGGQHLPLCMISDTDFSLQVTLFRLLKDAFAEVPDLVPQVSGVLTVEHCATPSHKHEGICLSFLVTIRTKDNKSVQVNNEEKYEWHTITDAGLRSALTEKMEKDMAVPLLLLR